MSSRSRRSLTSRLDDTTDDVITTNDGIATTNNNNRKSRGNVLGQAVTTTPIKRKNPKWSALLFSSSPLSRYQHQPQNLTTLTTPPSSSRQRLQSIRLPSSLTTTTTTTTTTNDTGPTKKKKNLMVSYKRWSAGSTTANSVKKQRDNFDTVTTTWTIDDALRSLYDYENNDDNNNNNSTISDDPTMQRHSNNEDDSSLMNWWDLDDGNHYTTKKERNLMRHGRVATNSASEQQIAENDDNDEEVDHDEDENATKTLKLFEELHADPLIGILEMIELNSNNDMTSDGSVIKETCDVSNDENDNDDDFGDFQSASTTNIMTENETVISSSPLIEKVKETSTRNEPTPLLYGNHDSEQLIHEMMSQVTQEEEEQQEILQSVVRAISFDEEDNDELIRYVDAIVLCGGGGGGDPKNTTTNQGTTSPSSRRISANNTNTSSSSLGTPDLVRIVDDIVDAAAAAASATMSSTQIDVVRHDKNNDDEDDKNEIDQIVVDPVHMKHDMPCNEQIIKEDIVIAPLPLSMLLPVGNDLSTLESRFIRRLQQLYRLDEGCDSSNMNENQNSHNVSKATYLDLPIYYFTAPELDDTVSVLHSMPWEYVLPTNTRGVGSFDALVNNDMTDSTEAWELWDEYITSRLCQLDTAREAIQADTLRQIQPHQDRIDRTNILIHECDQSLRLSFMYYERAQQAIDALMGSDDEDIGLVGPSILLRSFQQRDEYRQLYVVLDQLDNIWTGERDIMNRIDRFDVKNCNALDEYFAVMKLAKDLDRCVSDTKLSRLQCLVALRDRLKSIGMRFSVRLLDIARSLVVRTCRNISNFDSDQYERVLRAMIDLKSQSIVDKSVAGIDLPSSWTENILNAESYEVDRVFASALLKPTNCEASSHEMELKQSTYELDLHWGDYTMLRGILRNLVNIRFDFEWQLHYLPRVYHQLCKHLTNILLSHNILVKWHRDFARIENRNESSDASMEPLSEHSDMASIHNLMSGYTLKLWEHCEGILSNCLDEYLSFSPKRPLFRQCANGTDDRLWRESLERLHNIFSLSNTFLTLKKSFLGSVDITKDKSSEVKGVSQCLLASKLICIFRRHLRVIHVEAMNTLGRSLANESWLLGSFVVSAEPERTGQPELSIGSILVRAMQAASRRSEPVSNEVKNTTCELSISYDSHSPNTNIAANENPFNGVARSNISCNTSDDVFAPIDDVELSDHIVYRTLSSFIHEHDGSIRLAPDSVSKELIAWIARLLLVLEKLPLIAEDVSNVLMNLCDLYLTTVFRLCSGNAKNERLILGDDSPLPIYVQPDEPKGCDKGGGAQMFGSFRGSPKKTGSGKKLSRRSIVPVNLNAEICFPRPLHRDNVSVLHNFIDRAQKSLQDAVNLDMIDSWLVDPHVDSPEEQGCEVTRVLIKREGSISSCYTVAALIEVAQKTALQNQSSLLRQEFVIDRELSSLRLYSQSVLDIIPYFARVARQIACTRAISGASVVKDILRVDTGWEECKLHEYANDYIDDLSYRCALIWGYLAASNKLPLIIMRETWEGIVSASYLSLLDGFSRIRQCSTEGRSLMALDLASFKAGLSPTNIAERLDGVVLVNKPPPVNPEINFFFVETYIKVFYYPTDDVFNWMKENRDQYSMSYTVGLYTAVFLSRQEQKSEESFNEMMKNIKALYPMDEKRDSISIHQV